MARVGSLRELSFWLGVALISISSSVLFKVLASRLPDTPSGNAVAELSALS